MFVLNFFIIKKIKSNLSCLSKVFEALRARNIGWSGTVGARIGASRATCDCCATTATSVAQTTTPRRQAKKLKAMRFIEISWNFSRFLEPFRRQFQCVESLLRLFLHLFVWCFKDICLLQVGVGCRGGPASLPVCGMCRSVQEEWTLKGPLKDIEIIKRPFKRLNLKTFQLLFQVIFNWFWSISRLYRR